MKKLRKMFVLMGTVTLMVNFCSFNILAEDGIKQVSEVQTINPRSGNVYYKYKSTKGYGQLIKTLGLTHTGH